MARVHISEQFNCQDLVTILHDLRDARRVLRDILERMEDHYDGAPDAKPSLPFNGNDMEEIQKVLG